jgi:hypothetical protein
MTRKWPASCSTGVLAPLVGLFAARLARRYINLEGEGLKRRSESLPCNDP